MTVSFRLGRYLVALLWSWSLPLCIGVVLGGLYISHAHIEILEANDDLFLRSFEAVIDRCTATTDPPPDNPSPPASVTGQLGLPDQPANFPPVAGDGGETG